MTLTLAELAKKYGVHPRTIRRWMSKEGTYFPKKGYRPGKIDAKKASEIRHLYQTDQYTQSELAKRFGVTQAAICRIVNNKTHRVDVLITGAAKVRILD